MRTRVGSKRHVVACLSCVVAVVVASQLSPRAQASTIVISGATLIDGTGAPPIRDASLVIRNGRVAEVLKGGAKAPADAQIIDAKGKTVIPGLIDGHVHYRPWMGELCLASGVTTIVDLGNADEWVKALIEARELGKIRMPRMFASGSRLGAREDVRRKKLIQPVAAHKPHFVFVDVEKGKEMIREKKKNGLHIIKVDETWTKEDLKQLVDLAHSLDMPIVGHATDPRDSALAGQDAIMHMYGLTVGVADPAKVDALYRQELADVYSPLDPGRYRDLITLLIKEDVALNIQLARDFALKRQREYMAQDQQLLSRPQLQYVPMGVRVNTFRTHQKALGRSHEELESWEKIKRFVREFVAAGGKMIAGADTVAFSLPGYGLWRELDGLAEAGVEPMKIILSATKNVADLYRLKEVGTLEPGKLADLLILNGDPLADLRNLEKIDTVMIGGEVVDRAFHAEYHNVFERPYAEDTGPGLPPVLREISPRLSVEGSGPLDLTVTGIRFDEFTSVVFDGVAVSTTLVTPRELKARIPADLLKRAGTFRVTLDDPRFLGAPSDYYGFIVKYRR